MHSRSGANRPWAEVSKRLEVLPMLPMLPLGRYLYQRQHRHPLKVIPGMQDIHYSKVKTTILSIRAAVAGSVCGGCSLGAVLGWKAERMLPRETKRRKERSPGHSTDKALANGCNFPSQVPGFSMEETTKLCSRTHISM